MFGRRQSVYNLILCLCVSLFAIGCGRAGNDGTNGSLPDAAQSQEAPDVPTITLPDEDAGPSSPSTTSEGSAE